MFAQDEYAMNQKNFNGFEVRMTSSNFGEVSSKFSQNRHTLINTSNPLVQTLNLQQEQEEQEDQSKM